ncbi:hypothetical protein HAX54_024146 [Datura stramonium]|uniref:Uncharacterized protein n=1 Tax=Datura stramonium TaxID=4076 RepID=A0ABS8S560_DATST|nr:hypothetical protein [Datura stramonium]
MALPDGQLFLAGLLTLATGEVAAESRDPRAGRVPQTLDVARARNRHGAKERVIINLTKLRVDKIWVGMEDEDFLKRNQRHGAEEPPYPKDIIAPVTKGDIRAIDLALKPITMKTQLISRKIKNLKKRAYKWRLNPRGVQFVALQEPFIDASNAEKYKRAVSNALENRNGKIWCLWDDSLDCSVVSNSNQQVTLRMNHIGSAQPVKYEWCMPKRLLGKGKNKMRDTVLAPSLGLMGGERDSKVCKGWIESDTMKTGTTIWVT